MLTNFPLRHAALSPDGDDVAVAGSRGLALYSRRRARWRLFGDVSQVLTGSTSGIMSRCKRTLYQGLRGQMCKQGRLRPAIVAASDDWLRVHGRRVLDVDSSRRAM